MASSTIRSRLYSLVFLWLAVFSVLGGVFVLFSLSRFRSAAIEQRLLVGRLVAGSLDAQLFDQFSGLRQLASDIDLSDSRTVERLRAFRFRSPFRHAIYVVDDRADVVIADPAVPEAIAPEYLVGRESVTPMVHKSAGGSVVAAVQPFEVSGRRYSIVAEMRPLRSPISSYLQGLAADGDFYLFIVDSDGAVIAAPDHGAVLEVVPELDAADRRPAPRQPSVVVDSACHVCPGEGKVTGFVTLTVPLELAPWRVVIQEHRSRVFGAVYRSQWILAGALALLAFTGAFLAWTLSRSVAEPILELSRQAERLRQGDLRHQIRVDADREISLLALTLDDARRQLAASLGELEAMNENLEMQVEERTREIQQFLDRALVDDAQRRTLVRRLLSAGEE